MGNFDPSIPRPLDISDEAWLRARHEAATLASGAILVRAETDMASALAIEVSSRPQLPTADDHA